MECESHAEARVAWLDRTGEVDPRINPSIQDAAIRLKIDVERSILLRNLTAGGGREVIIRPLHSDLQRYTFKHRKYNDGATFNVEPPHDQTAT